MESGKRKGDPEMLAACAESGSLKVKIMRLDTPSSQQQTQMASHPQHHQHGASYYQPSQYQPMHLQQSGASSLGQPPSSIPSLGVGNSLLGGGIQQPPSMVVDTRNFDWFPDQQGAPPVNVRPRAGSLPSYSIDPSIHGYRSSTIHREV